MKIRLDDLLIKRKNASSKKDAFVLVTGGKVIVNGQKMISPAQMVSEDANIEIRGEKKWVGRGAEKLEAALKEFKISVEEKICVDIGAATGGFTQVLLARGAKKVYAIDTARGKLDLKLRKDSRVVPMEQTDVRKVESLPDVIDIITIDVSLIPLEYILPHAARLLKSDGEIIALLKPQYQTRDLNILKHGIVRDPEARSKILSDFEKWLSENSWIVKGKIESPIRGDKGNVEYLLLLRLK